MAISKEDILEAVGALSVMELNDLVKAFEEKFGVSAAAMAAPAAGGAARRHDNLAQLAGLHQGDAEPGARHGARLHGAAGRMA